MQQYMKKKYIKNYLDNNGYDTECIDDLSNKEIDEVYDLYHNNIATPNTNLYGYYGTYYQIKKEYNQMVKYDVLAFEKNQDDEGPLERLYEYWRWYPINIDPIILGKICVILKDNHSKSFKKFYQLIDNIPKLPININNKKQNHNIQQNDDISTQIINATKQAIQQNDQSRIIELFDVCTNDQEKIYYLSKAFTVKDFKPTKEMVKDVMRLDFDTNASLEVRMVKAIFSGCSI